MALIFAKSQRDPIHSMISSGLFINRAIAEAASYTPFYVRVAHSNIPDFGSTRAPRNGSGPKRTITPLKLDALCEHLFGKPRLFRTEIIVFFWDEFEVLVTVFSIRRALAFKGWSKKITRRVGNGRNADLRDLYLHKLSDFRCYHLVYADKSGCDNSLGLDGQAYIPL